MDRKRESPTESQSERWIEKEKLSERGQRKKGRGGESARLSK